MAGPFFVFIILAVIIVYPFSHRTLRVVAILALLSLGRPCAPVQAATFTLDGLREDAYTLLAQDPSGDLAGFFSSSPATNWADLTNLYVATDTTNLWIYVDLPNYGSASSSSGVFGLAIDTDGLADSGGTQGPMNAGITFAYTSTGNNIGATPVTSTQVLLPDVVIRGQIYNQGSLGAGYTELYHWNAISTTWEGAGVNWGGVDTSAIGAHVAFALGHGLELSIPFADLGVPPTTTLNLEFYATGTPRPGHMQGAWDTVPSDEQSPTDETVGTTEQRLATFNPQAPRVEPVVSFSSSAYAVFEAAGPAPITITVAPTSTRTISVTFGTANGTADLADYVPVSRTVRLDPGQALAVVPLQVLTDTAAPAEPDETVLLALGDPINARLGQPFTATLTIHDSPPVYHLFAPFLHR